MFQRLACLLDILIEDERTIRGDPPIPMDTNRVTATEHNFKQASSFGMAQEKAFWSKSGCRTCPRAGCLCLDGRADYYQPNCQRDPDN